MSRNGPPKTSGTPIPFSLEPKIPKVDKLQVSKPTQEEFQRVKDELTSRVSFDHFTLLFPTETETKDFFANMPNFNTLRKNTEATIATAQQAYAQNVGGKRKISMSEDVLVLERQPSKKPFRLGGETAMEGFSNIPFKVASQAETGASRGIGPRPAIGALGRRPVVELPGTGAQPGVGGYYPDLKNSNKSGFGGGSTSSLKGTQSFSQRETRSQTKAAELKTQYSSPSSQEIGTRDYNIPGWVDRDGEDKSKAWSAQQSKTFNDAVLRMNAPKPTADHYVEEHRRLKILYVNIKAAHGKAIQEKEKYLEGSTFKQLQAARGQAGEAKQEFLKIWAKYEKSYPSRSNRDAMMASYRSLIEVPKASIKRLMQKWELEKNDLQKEKDAFAEWVRVREAPNGKEIVERDVADMMFDECWIKNCIDLHPDFLLV